MPPRIYLAGPEVFLPDAAEQGRRKAALCAAAGFEGVFPLDPSLKLDGLPLLEQGRRIFSVCETLMRTCDLVIANLTPFRGVSMDSGTAYEVGFMRALGKPVFGYTNVTEDIAERARAFRARGIPAGDADRPDLEIESFGQAENLMIAIAAVETGAQVVRGRVAPGTEMTDLAAFKTCLGLARQLMAGPRS